MAEGEVVAQLFRRRDDHLAAIDAIDKKLLFEFGITVVKSVPGAPAHYARERVVPPPNEQR